MKYRIILEADLPEGEGWDELTAEVLNNDFESTGGDMLQFVVAEGVKVTDVERDAPAEGGTDASKWNADEWHLFLCQHADNRATSPYGLSKVALRIADALAAKEAEISKIRGWLDNHRAVDLAQCRELKAKSEHIAELEAALRPFAEIDDPSRQWNLADNQRARAVLSRKEPQ